MILVGWFTPVSLPNVSTTQTGTIAIGKAIQLADTGSDSQPFFRHPLPLLLMEFQSQRAETVDLIQRS
jgi:hypothetical protein